MTISECTKSKGFKIAAAVIGIFILMLGSFAAGISVGFHKAKYSYNWGENYERNFMGRHMRDGRGGMMGESREGMMDRRSGFMDRARGFADQIEGRGFRNAHGMMGTILSISDNSLVVKNQDGQENTVTMTDQTIIHSRGENLTRNDLKVNDRIAIIGKPGDNGAINANLIRVFEAVDSNNGNSGADNN